MNKADLLRVLNESFDGGFGVTMDGFNSEIEEFFREKGDTVAGMHGPISRTVYPSVPRPADALAPATNPI